MPRDGQPRGLIPRFNPELLAQAFETAERIEDSMRQLSERMESLHRRELRGEAASRSAVGTADGANPLFVSVAPSAGNAWEVFAIGVTADTVGSRVIAFCLEESLELALFNLSTSTTAGGVQGVFTAGMPLPAGMRLSARFPSNTPANTRCVLHVVAREYATS